MTRLPSVPLKDVVWEDTYISKMHDNPQFESQWLYKIKLPDWLAIWDVFAAWELKHILSMRKHLKKGEILFDIGAEVGWQSVLFADIVGANNLVLVEPAGDFWPNIKAIWKKNTKSNPLNCYCGLFSNVTTLKKVLSNHEFPPESKGYLSKGLSYRYIHEHHELPQITLDDYCELTGIKPDALTIDVEGAELLVLKGAESTLKDNDIKVWVSIHPELLELNYNSVKNDVIDYMKSLDYDSEYLDNPNEEHWYFRKVKK